MKCLYAKIKKDGRKGGRRVSFPKSFILERLKEKTVVQKGPLETECFIWIGTKNEDGYGSISYKAKLCRSHRLSWLFHFGPIPKKMEVCHKCDNPSCWNPKHLFLATHAENMRDAAIKKRAMGHKGEDHPNSKLTEAQVLEIREKFKRGNGRILAKKFGVSDNNIYMVASRQSWTHI